MEEKVRLQFFLWRFQNQIPSRPDIIVHHPIPSIFLWAFYLFFVETFGNWEGGKWIHFLTNLCTSLWNLPIKLDKVYNINIPSPLLSEWFYLREVFQKTKWKSLMEFSMKAGGVSISIKLFLSVLSISEDAEWYCNRRPRLKSAVR